MGKINPNINNEKVSNIEKEQHYTKEYYVTKEAVTNELAKRWIVESLDVEGNIELPDSWFRLAEMKHENILSMMRAQKSLEEKCKEE